MHQTTLNTERRFVFISFLGLTLFGMLMIYEASSFYAYRMTTDAAYFFEKQITYFVIGLALFFAALFVDIGFLRRHAKNFLLGTLLLLLVTLVIGRKAGGATRWVKFAFFNFQPSELLKIAYLLYCCDYFVRKKALIRHVRQGLMPIGMVLMGMCALLLVQPDLGNVVFWIGWTFLFLFLYRARRKHLAFLVISGVVVLSLLIALYPYRFRRIIAYLDPFSDPQGAGFQLIQSQIAYGDGGMLGVGLGDSRQKLFFLPAAHTDFIFSIIAEEFGLWGSLLIIGLFVLLLYKMLGIARRIRDDFRRSMAWGITFIFFLEIIINIGVSCGLFPTKGLSLPFISYGGSNLIVHFVLLGLFFNASKERAELPGAVVSERTKTVEAAEIV